MAIALNSVNHSVDRIFHADGAQSHEERTDNMRAAEICQEEGGTDGEQHGKHLPRHAQSPPQHKQDADIQRQPYQLSGYERHQRIEIRVLAAVDEKKYILVESLHHSFAL